MIITTPNRQIVLDTETTGMNMGSGTHYQGHKVIEIGAVEVINRRLTGNHFHVYIKPDRLVDPEAFAIHGISDQFLADKPTFAEIADDFYRFIQGAELIIHNASFDVGFLDYEYQLIKPDFPKLETYCVITDTLAMARRLFPGKRNNLDILCERYLIDNSHRTLHGALLDAEILAEVYLAMTGGQTSLAFSAAGNEVDGQPNMFEIQRIQRSDSKLKVIYASDDELAKHDNSLDKIDKKSGGAIWRA